MKSGSTSRLLRVAMLALLCGSAARPLPARADKLVYPPARTEAATDTYGSTVVADPYRWLESLDSDETKTWLAAEGALTRKVLDAVPGREAIDARLTALSSIPRATTPIKRGSRYFYSRSTGSENQSLWYVQDGAEGQPRVLLDPNTLAADGTVALTNIEPNDDGSLVAYKLSENGSDFGRLRVRTVSTGADHVDDLQRVRSGRVVWRPDGDGFYYKHYPQPGSVPAGEENFHGAIYYHHLGTPQNLDQVVFRCTNDSLEDADVRLTHNGRYLIFTTMRGTADVSEISALDRTQLGATPVPLLSGFDARYTFLDALNGKFYFWSTANAPHGKIIVMDFGPGKKSKPRDLVPESGDVIAGARMVNSQIVVVYMHDATSRIVVYNLDTTKALDIPLPGLGSVRGLGGESVDAELFFDYSSFIEPSTVYSYNLLTKTMKPFFPAAPLAFVPADFVTEQVWYASKDGTKIPMFVTHKKGLALDGQRPAWLTGYGGFNISRTPAFSPAVIAWCEKGGVYALPNLRGGGEYGRTWHEAGMLEKKQNVFDDFIAAGEYLIAQKYTSPSKLAIEGGSNGGLLTAACLVQRPELFGAAIVRVPVADMLRYHRFTVGRYWVSEYGSADDPAQFPFLYKYSPLHNVKDGVKYPATLVTTADHDDRVFPGLAFKFAARLQAASGGSAPILLRVDTKAGHGHDKPTAKRVDENVDLFAFLYQALGVN